MELLRQSLRWLHADCYSEFDVHASMVAPNASMFGVRGAEDVLSFKRRFLIQAVNYEIDAILDVDMPNRVVVASFECLIPGKEGRGTDVMQFDEHFRVSGVNAIRHTRVE